MLGPFTLRFHNARMEKLTHRVMCLAGTAMVLVFARTALNFTTNMSVAEEFHANDSISPEQAERMNSPYVRISAGIVALLLGLAVPCCGYFGAKNNNRLCLWCFAWCNCCSACLQILLFIGFVLLIASMGVMQASCQPIAGLAAEQQKCPGILKGCAHMQSAHFNLETYEGCFDHMIETFPPIYCGLGIAIGVTCCIMCFQCASCHWGRELYNELEREELCIASSDEGF